jgi:Ca2+-binding RTX toxin-like protein
MSKSRRPLTLESLESRQLMHADVSLGNSGILLIEADPTGGTVQVSNFWGLVRVNSRTEEGSQTRFFSRPSVKQIVFRGSENDDVFANNTSIPSLQFGKGGNDQLHGGSARDVIFGGDGNDWIQGDAGNDLLYGDRGNDLIVGGAGNDRLWGGDGRDFLFGAAGDDSLYGGRGNDWLLGGRGFDPSRGEFLQE